jgi:Leucine carboxyl methyltransferase
MAGDDAADLSGVGWTATGIAAIRALETARPDRLFKDPLAARFVAASGRSLANRQAAAGADERTRRHWSAIQQWVVVRTRFLDELLVRACREGCSQVIVLGAGLDARAFRLHWPAGVRLLRSTFLRSLRSRNACWRPAMSSRGARGSLFRVTCAATGRRRSPPREFAPSRWCGSRKGCSSI